ncbi:MAG: BspA family leucine-rich repeat surface protein [Cellulosilyticaceae bacterium]
METLNFMTIYPSNIIAFPNDITSTTTDKITNPLPIISPDIDNAKTDILPTNVIQSPNTPTVLSLELNLVGTSTKPEVSKNIVPTLNIQNGTNNDLIIDWGDNSTSLLPPGDTSISKQSSYTSSFKRKTVQITITTADNSTGLYTLGTGDPHNLLPVLTFSNNPALSHPLTAITAGSNSSVGVASFYKCYNLKTVNLAACDTSNVTDMSYMFFRCNNLESLDLSSFNTEKVTNMSNMFFRCSNLSKVLLYSFNTAQVTDMSYMFFACSSLTSIDFSYFNTANVKNMSQMFSGCSKLNFLDLSTFNTLNTDNMSEMFDTCIKLQQVILGKDFKFNGDSSYLPEPQGLYIHHADNKWHDISTDIAYAPNELHKDATTTKTYVAVSFIPPGISINTDLLDLSIPDDNINNSLTVNARSTADHKFSYQWYRSESNSLDNGILLEGETSASYTIPTDLKRGVYYYYCKLTSENYPTVYTRVSTVIIHSSTRLIIDLNLLPSSVSNFKPTLSMQNNTDTDLIIDWGDNTSSVFPSDTSVTSISKPSAYPAKDKYEIRVNLVSPTSELYTLGDGLTSKPKAIISFPDASSWSGDALTDVICGYNSSIGRASFYRCSNLTNVNLSECNTSNTENISLLFFECFNLEVLDLSPLDTSNINNMASTFVNCTNLKEVTLGKDFKFIGSLSYLPTPNSNFITNATGKWYDVSTYEAYNSTTLHENATKTTTYLATPLIFLSFDARSGTNIASIPITSNLSFPPNPTWGDNADKNNYAFGGWYTKPDGVGTLVTPEQSLSLDEDTTIYANWLKTTDSGTKTVRTTSLYFNNDTTDTNNTSAGWSWNQSSNTLTLDGITMNMHLNDAIEFDMTSNRPIILEIVGDVKLVCQEKNSSAIVSKSESLLIKGTPNSNLNISSNGDGIIGNTLIFKDLILDVNSTSKTAIVTNNPDSDNIYILNSSIESLGHTMAYHTVPLSPYTATIHSGSSKATATDKVYTNQAYASITCSSNAPSATTLEIDLTGHSNRTPTIYAQNNTSKDLIIDWGDNEFSTLLPMETQLSKPNAYSENANNYTISIYSTTGSDGLYTLGNGSYSLIPFSEESNGLISLVSGVLSTVIQYSFEGCRNLKSVDLSNCNTSSITSMVNMFNNCNSLISLDLSSFVTKNVTDMSHMFTNCNNLTSINLSSFNTQKVTDMSHMFTNCNSLTTIDLRSFDTQKVTDISYMFNNCSSLTSLDLGSFKTFHITDMSYMFNNCNNLTSINLSSFNTSKVTDMSHMFNNCNNLTSINLSSFDVSKVTTMMNMFSGCKSLTSIDSSSFKTPNITNMANMFDDCSNLITINLSSFDTSKVTDMSHLFSNCSNLTSINLSSFNTEKVTNISYMFNNCHSLASIDLSVFNTLKVTTMSYMFNNCRSLASIDLSVFNTSKVTDMSYMFTNCNSVKSLDLSSFVTQEVTDMSHMFTNCNSLASIDLSSFVTQKVTDMSHMFTNCNSLASIDLSSFSTDSVKAMDYMFSSGDTTKSDYTPKALQKLQRITLGENFHFKGNTSYLNSPDKTFIQNADGKWYDTATYIDYASSDVHRKTQKTTTYTATPLLFLSFDARNGIDIPNILITNNNNTLPPNPTWGDNADKNNYIFNGWYTELDGNGTLITTENIHNLTVHTTVYAHWTKTTASGTKTVRTKKLEFNSNTLNTNTSSEGWSWNQSSNTLTLDDTTINTHLDDAIKFDITFNKPIFIEIIGDVNITSQVSNGIVVSSTAPSLSINGMPNSKLNLNSSGNGILGNTLIFKNLTLDVSSSDKTAIATNKPNTNNIYILNSNIESLGHNASYNKVPRISSGATVSFGSSKSSAKDTIYTNQAYASIVSTPNDAYFASTLEIDLTGHSSRIPTINARNNTGKDLIIDWGDGELSTFSQNLLELSKPSAYSENTNKYTISIYRALGSDGLYTLGDGSDCILTFPKEPNGLISVVAGVSSTVGPYSFNGCTNLQNIDLSKCNTSGVTSMSHMFNNCTSLSSIDLSSFDTTTVKNMSSMFNNCSNLTSINLTSFNTENVTDMSYMFTNCTNLTSLDLTSFNTKNVTSMDYMFSSGDTSKADYTPQSLKKLQSITIGKDFKFLGDNSYLHAPNKDFIQNTDGKWYDTATYIAYAPPEVHKDATKTSTYVSTPFTALFFDARNGIDIPNMLIIDNNTLPPNPTWGDNADKNNYIFNGWYTELDGNGTLVTTENAQDLTTNTTVYAHWTKMTASGAKTVNTKTLEFNSDTPSDGPIDTPSDGPIDTPSDGPIDTPSDGPIDTPSDGPIDTPSDGPIDTPSDGPIDNLFADNHIAYMAGYPNSTFRPSNNITRTEIVILFARLLNPSIYSDIIYKPTFTDVKDNEWYSSVLGYMEHFNIIQGYPDGTFRGNNPISRAEFTVIANRLMPCEEGELNFTDVSPTHWATPFIASATKQGWLNGYQDNTFKPNKPLTRAEAVIIVNRMLNRSCTLDFTKNNLYTEPFLYNALKSTH